MPKTESAKTSRDRGAWRVRYLPAVVLICMLATACADRTNPPATSQPSSLRQRTREAFGEDAPSVSGADGEKFDRKGFRRDWDRFWNP